MSTPAPEAPAGGQQPQTLEGLAGQRQAAAPPTQPAASTTPEGQQQPPATLESGQAPWERDGQPFDPERAWQRIQNMQRDLDAARTQATTLQGRVTEFEQSAMTDQQRLEARATQAEQAAAESQRELMRYRVAAAKGVPAELLHGDDEAAMTAHADQLLTFRGEQPAPGVPSFDGGARTPSAGTDMNQLLRRQLGAGG